MELLQDDQSVILTFKGFYIKDFLIYRFYAIKI